MTNESGWFPVDEGEHAEQLSALRALLEAMPDMPRVLDLGAGAGRLAAPLVDLGIDVLAVDHDERAVEALRDRGVRTVSADFINAPASAGIEGPFDLVMCMGNTFCLVHEIDRAIELACWVRSVLRDGGVFVIDDILRSTWSDIASGNWQEGVSEDGSMQLVWGAGDALVAVREGASVDEHSWSIRETDTPMRLWSRGALELLAVAGGLARPKTDPSGCLIVFTRTPS